MQHHVHCKNIHSPFIVLAFFLSDLGKKQTDKTFSRSANTSGVLHFKKKLQLPEKYKFRVWTLLGFVVPVLPC